MPSEKSMRVSSRKTRYNHGTRTVARSAVTAARQAIARGDQEESLAALARAASALSRAAKRGIIHRNNASRRRSRLAKSLQALTQQGE